MRNDVNIFAGLFLMSQSSGTHLHIEQLVPLGYDEEADAVYGSRQLHVIDQQSQKNHVRKQSGEVNHLWHTNTNLQQMYITQQLQSVE